MTTPAINVNEYGYVTGHSEILDLENRPISPVLDIPNRISNRVEKQRPSSTSNPKDSQGWRNPRGWYNRGYESNLNPIGSLKIRLPGDSFYYHLWDGAGWNGLGAGFLDPISSTLVAKARNKALSKLKNQKVNLGQMFREREETAGLVASLTEKIVDTTRAYKNKSWKDWLRAQSLGVPGRRGGFPESFLEYRYGLSPLMEDVHGACQALNQKELSSDGKYIFHVSGRAGTKDQFLYFKPTNLTSYAGFRAVCVRTDKAECSLYYSLENPLMASLAQLGILNLPALWWERQPFSFVADWFAPIGPYLNLLDAAVGYQFLSGTESTLSRETDTGFFAIRDGAPAGLEATWLGDQWNYRGWSMNRTVLSSSPLPLWEGFKNPFPKNGLHVQNAIALLASVYRSKTRTDYA